MWYKSEDKFCIFSIKKKLRILLLSIMLTCENRLPTNFLKSISFDNVPDLRLTYSLRCFRLTVATYARASTLLLWPLLTLASPCETM